jgi:MerR family mercuric resistance operon transcriptional regulator
MKPLTIGQAAKGAGIGIETLRFYERQGLIDVPPRSSCGYRQYPKEVIARLLFIRRAQNLGFSLKEIKGLISLRLDSSPDLMPDRGAIKAQAEAKIADIDGKLEALQRMKAALTRLVQACQTTAPGCSCPILQALEAE